MVKEAPPPYYVATGLRVGGMTEEVGTGCHLADLSVADWWRCLAIAAYREGQAAVIGQMQVLCFDRTVDPVERPGALVPL